MQAWLMMYSERNGVGATSPSILQRCGAKPPQGDIRQNEKSKARLSPGFAL
jgi:hypothetical protein